jgi:hypothetical protein
MVVPFPLAVQDSWSYNGSGSRTVVSIDRTVRAPAGEFTNCLMVRHHSGRDDGAITDRFYAPGIGLVQVQFGNEATAWSLELVAHNVPLDVCMIHCADARRGLAAPLARALAGEGVLVDFVSYQMNCADEFATLAESSTRAAKYAVAVISPSFLDLSIGRSDLDGVMTNVRFFILHDVSLDEAQQYCPALAGRLLGEGRKGIAPLAEQIAQVIHGWRLTGKPTQAADRAYFPLIPGMVLTYQGEGDDGKSRSQFEVLQLRRLPAHTEAVCVNRWWKGTESGERRLIVTRSSSGVSRDQQLEVPFPLTVGKEWSVGYDRYAVKSLDSVVETPKSLFAGIQITYEIAQSEEEFAHRYYAPWIGLVREDNYGDERWKKELVDYHVPYEIFLACQ